MQERLRIYVAGPYSATEPAASEANTKRAIDAGLDILRMGHIPFIPHLTHYVDLRAKESGTHLNWEDYINWDLAWLELCDAVLFLGHSKGADLELARAKQLGKRIFFSLADVPKPNRAATNASAFSSQ